MEHRLAVLNQKGGVGKTTTAVNLGAALALAGSRILVIDLDPQSHLSLHLGLDPQEGEHSSARVLRDEKPLSQCILETSTVNLHILPASVDRVEGRWQSGADRLVVVRGDADGLVVRLTEGSA